MVRRLVEQKQIRLHHEQPCEVRAHDPPAAHLLCGTRKIFLAIAEAAQHPLRLRVHLRIAQRLVLRVSLHVFGALDVAGLFERVQFFLQLREIARAARRDVEHGLVADGFRLLREEADHRPRIALDGAGVRIVLAENEREKRGLARAVWADECDALAVVHLHGSALEKNAPAEAFADVTDGQHGLEMAKVRWCAAGQSQKAGREGMQFCAMRKTQERRNDSGGASPQTRSRRNAPVCGSLRAAEATMR